MSRDQRPGRVRVFNSNQPPETPQRRRGDLEALDPETGAARIAPASPAVVEAEPPKSFSMLALSILFLVGCGMGGALITVLGLFEVPR